MLLDLVLPPWAVATPATGASVLRDAVGMTALGTPPARRLLNGRMARTSLAVLVAVVDSVELDSFMALHHETASRAHSFLGRIHSFYFALLLAPVLLRYSSYGSVGRFNVPVAGSNT